MYYKITHTTKYTYNQPVLLKAHSVRLLPRSDAWQKVHSYDINIVPTPDQLSQITDLDGNNIAQAWFVNPTESLEITISSSVETLKTNPFDYILESWALTIPFDYPSSVKEQLNPYLQPYQFSLDPVAYALGQEILLETDGDTLSFLYTLNLRIFRDCEYLFRETGKPWPPGITWNKKQGTCRDYAVLFMEVCRSVGIAARFVSGYNQGDRTTAQRDLHAWVEVYLPGGGFRGYDPTLGLAVSDGHIAVASSAIPFYAASVYGDFIGVKSLSETGIRPRSSMSSKISIEY